MKTFLLKTQLAATLVAVCAMFASCVDVTDNPANPTTPDAPSTIDTKKWTINDAYMDLSVNPGDNFFRYCNGAWLDNNLPVEQNDIRGFWENDCPNLDAVLYNSDMPALKKIENDLVQVEVTSEQAAELLLQASNKLMSCTTEEEMWTVMASLAKQGFSTPIEFDMFAVGGKMKYIIAYNEHDLLPDVATDGTSNDEEPFHLRIRKNPQLLAAMKPLCSAHTRGVADTAWPMLAAYCRQLGINPANVYLPSEYYDLNGQRLGTYATFAENTQKLTQLESLKGEDLRMTFISHLLQDNPFVSVLLLNKFNETYSEKYYGGAIATHNDLINIIFRKYLSYSINHYITNQIVTPAMKQRTLDFCEELRAVFAERIDLNTWMSESSKSNARKKLQAMQMNAGCPDNWQEEYITDLSECGSLLEDVLAMRASELGLLLSLEDQDKHSAAWNYECVSQLLTEQNAFYNPNFNAMFIFPFWMLSPLYDDTQSDAINYAHLQVIGHEMTHGFDTNGSFFNENGDLGSIFTGDSDRILFQQKANKLADFYSSQNVFEGLGFASSAAEQYGTLMADGNYTISEDIADFGGFTLAYAAYNNKLKREGYYGDEMKKQQRRFYRAFANLWRTAYSPSMIYKRTVGPDGKDVHALPKERINCIVANTDDWYDLFDVIPGQKLYLTPEKRARIW